MLVVVGGSNAQGVGARDGLCGAGCGDRDGEGRFQVVQPFEKREARS